jgi:hypothetical protein
MARSGDLRRKTPVFVVAVSAPARRSTTRGAAMHPTATTTSHRGRFTWCASPSASAARTVPCHDTRAIGTQGVVRQFWSPAVQPRHHLQRDADTGRGMEGAYTSVRRVTRKFTTPKEKPRARGRMIPNLRIKAASAGGSFQSSVTRKPPVTPAGFL